MDGKEEKLHVFLFPLMAQGHMIPMIDMARLFAEHGLLVTIITTPLNSSRFKTSIERAQDSGHRIHLLHLRFPCYEAGLPLGCENIDTVPSIKLRRNFFMATQMLQKPFEELLREHNPDFIISDSFLPWTLESARKFHIPRLVFHGTSCFSQCCSHSMVRYATHEELATHSEIIVIPDLPDLIKMTRTQIPDFAKMKIQLGDLFERIGEADRKSFGVVFNTFYELEPAYVNYYQTVMGMKAWSIGPVSLCNRELVDKADRGNRVSIEQSSCLGWLDSNKPRSVLYVCFGSLSRFPPSQLMAIAVSLEACNHPFIWVIGRGDDEIEEWLPEGYEERIGERGLMIRGWAPQILILSHPSTGGFMTHCGWNSILEGVSAGVPFITWPVSAEQFYNEKLIVQVLQIGVGVGNEVWALRLEHEIVNLVKREKIEQTVELVMGRGEEAKGLRKRAMQYREMATIAMEEGGSSRINLMLLIKDIVHDKENKIRGLYALNVSQEGEL